MATQVLRDKDLINTIIRGVSPFIRETAGETFEDENGIMWRVLVPDAMEAR